MRSKKHRLAKLLCYIAPFLVACAFLVPARASRVVQNGIDYSLDMSSYLGGSDWDSGRDIVADDNGNIYVTGGTASTDFPTTAGIYDPSYNGINDVFVTKFDPAGNLIWSTYIGGPNYDRAYAIELDSQGNIYLGGRAGAGYPTTAGVLQPNFGGDINPGHYGQQDGFVSKLDSNGNLIWSTYFGGNDGSFIRDIDVDSSGQVHLAMSEVYTPNPHITPGAFQGSLSGGADGVVAKLSSDASHPIWATYFGGPGPSDFSGPAIRVHPSGNVYVVGGTNAAGMPTTVGAYDQTYNGGWDYHLAKFSPDGVFLFGTFLGGSQGDSTETHGLEVDAQGNAIMVGTTVSGDFPTTPGAFQRAYGGSGGVGTGRNTNYNGDGFISKISSDGSQLMASTYLGGRYGDGVEGVGLDAQGNVYVSGATFSDNFPVTANAYQSNNGGQADYLVARLSADLSQIQYASYLGGSDVDYGRTAHADASGNVYMAGQTSSSNWPTQGAFQPNYGGSGDIGVAKFVVAASPIPPYTEFMYLPIVLNGRSSNLTASSCSPTPSVATRDVGS